MPRRSLGDLATPSFTQSYATGVELGRSLADSKSMREVRDAQLKDLMTRSLRDTLRDKRVHDPAMLARTARVLDPAQEFTPEDATALMGVDFKHYSDTIGARNTNVTMENAQADQKLQKEMQDAILKDKLAERERQDEQDRWARQDRAFKLFKEYYPTKTEAEIKRYTDSNSLMELMSRNKHLQTEQELSSVQATIERSEAWVRVNELSDLLNGEDPIQKIAGKGGGKPKPGEGPQATYLTKGTEKESALERMADLVSGAMPAKEFEYNKDSNTYEPKNEKDRESLRRIQTGIAFLSSLDVDGTPLPTGVMRELSLLEIMPLIIENELPLNAKPGKKSAWPIWQGGFLQSLKDRLSGGGGGGEGTGTGGDGTGVNASTADSPPPEPELKNTLLGFPWQQVEDLADKVIAEIGDSEDPSAVPDEMARRMIEAKGRDLSGADIRQINKTLKSRAEATSGSTPAPEQALVKNRRPQ